MVLAEDHRKSYRVEDCDKSGAVWQSRRVVFKPMFGLLNQEKLIPLRFCPLQIELELVTNGADAVYVNMERCNGAKSTLLTGMFLIFNASWTF